MMLTGIRILAVEQYGAGPFASQLFAEMGAEVIKLENPLDGGDVSRSVGPVYHAGLPQSAGSVFFQGLNRGKKSVTLNLATAEGQALFNRLVESAHAVLTNLRGDVAHQLGLTYETLAAHNPAIICAHLSGYGREGSRARWPGYDFLMQAEAGHFTMTGEPGSPPARMGLSMVDFMSGSLISLALLAGLREVDRTGKGRDVDVSLFDTALYSLNYVGNWYLNGEKETARLPRSSHPSLTPCQLYQTRDGWIYLMCNKEKFWRILCEKISRPEWIDDPRLSNFEVRLTAREWLTSALDEVLSDRTTADWLAHFDGQVPAAPIYDVKQALTSEFVAEHGNIESLAVAGGAPLNFVRSPIRFDNATGAIGAAPALGADTDAVLGALAAPEKLRELRARHVI